LPQFMDIFYHLLSGWGFIQAGGYSGWDFWQYAPFGRVNIYPPFFQILLALLMKLGFNAIILAKFFETTTPIIFLIVVWWFIRKHYSQSIAFFTLVTFGSAFSFHLSLMNHIPSTLVFIFGILALDQMFKRDILRASIILALCFYTHIGASWFFIVSFFTYALFDKQYRKEIFLILLFALALALPILIAQFSVLNFITITGSRLGEKFFCQIKFIDYFLAAGGLFFVLKEKSRYYLFLSFLLASLIFLPYPYRFISCEGYFPIIILSAFFLLKLWGKWQTSIILRRILISLVVLLLFFSPTLSLSKLENKWVAVSGIKFSDSVLTSMLSAKGSTIWFPEDYLPAASLIKANSDEGDIIYSSLGIFGPVLGSVTGRATANGLLTEVKSSQRFDPILASKITVLTNDLDDVFLKDLVKAYNLQKIGETRIFFIYKNPATELKTRVRKANIPFWMILMIIGAGVGVFLRGWRRNPTPDKMVKKN